MAKNQIIITLKPEQIEELQRLAEEAGIKTLSIFVRNQLLANLGTGSKPAISGSESIELPNLRMLAADLKRIHSELKGFVTTTQTNAPQPSSQLPAEHANAFGDIPTPSLSSTPVDSPLPTLEEVVRMFEESQNNLQWFTQFNKFLIPPDLGELGEPGDIEEVKKLRQKDDKDPLAALIDDPSLLRQPERHTQPTIPSIVKDNLEPAAATSALKSSIGSAAFSQTSKSLPLPPPPPSIFPPETDFSGGPPPKKRQ